jgi:hypothetical protein
MFESDADPRGDVTGGAVNWQLLKQQQDLPGGTPESHSGEGLLLYDEWEYIRRIMHL